MTKREKFLTNKNLLDEVIACKRNNNQMSEKLGKMFILLANKYGTKMNWNGYTYKDQMVNNAICRLCENWWKFDETKSETPNPFAYYTTVMANEFLQTLKKEKYETDIKESIAEIHKTELKPTYNKQAQKEIDTNF